RSSSTIRAARRASSTRSSASSTSSGSSSTAPSSPPVGLRRGRPMPTTPTAVRPWSPALPDRISTVPPTARCADAGSAPGPCASIAAAACRPIAAAETRPSPSRLGSSGPIDEEVDLDPGRKSTVLPTAIGAQAGGGEARGHLGGGGFEEDRRLHEQRHLLHEHPAAGLQGRERARVASGDVLD